MAFLSFYEILITYKEEGKDEWTCTLVSKKFVFFVQYYFRKTISRSMKWVRFVAGREIRDKRIGF